MSLIRHSRHSALYKLLWMNEWMQTGSHEVRKTLDVRTYGHHWWSLLYQCICIFATSCQAKLLTHINCDLANITVLWLLSPASETSLWDSCLKTCISLHNLILPSYCTLLCFVNFSIEIWWQWCIDTCRRLFLYCRSSHCLGSVIVMLLLSFCMCHRQFIDL